MKIYDSPSTQEKNVGVGTYGTEETRMNIIADYGTPALTGAGFNVRRNRPEMTLAQVIADSNAFSPDIHIEKHSNAGGGKGTEIWYDSGNAESKRLAECVYKYLAPLSPGVDRGVKAAAGQYGALRDTNAKAKVIVEMGFHDDPADSTWMVNQPKQIADAINQGIFDYAGIKQTVTDVLTPILGAPAASLEQAREWLRTKAPNYIMIADFYYAIALKYRIRPDVALAQACKETAFFRFGGLVKPMQNNFCGLGATGAVLTGVEELRGANPQKVKFEKGVHGVTFIDLPSGVEAHIQHLYAYAATWPMPILSTLLDPRFVLVKRGTAPYVEYLGAGENPAGVGWAYPGKDYGHSIVNDYLTELMTTKVLESIPNSVSEGEKAMKHLLDAGIIFSTHDLKTNVTWEELCFTLCRVLERK
jgi:N-acetylmuramoyl-L-alanine amidase